LFQLTCNILSALQTLFEREQPDLVVVQGDTTTTFVASLAAFYLQIPIAHVEAGLRTRHKFAPFPEEMNRALMGQLADFHFVPTERARKELINEGINVTRIFTVGNTVIDTLLTTLEKVRSQPISIRDVPQNVLNSRRIVLVTAHRRESFGEGFQNICQALRTIARRHGDVELIYPVHMNPNVREPVFRILMNQPNIHLTEPLEYLEFVWLMDKCYMIITDSGGIQEEATALGKPTLVMRDHSERPEAIQAGTARLVGADKERIVEETNRLLTDPVMYQQMSKVSYPFGDGHAARRIVEILIHQFTEE
jgi:UDP-N-acetylglucosamine 2-epimerase (non-hydrolysing)